MIAGEKSAGRTGPRGWSPAEAVMRNDRDPYWRRRDESYWRGRQEAHASYWKLTRQIRKSEHRGRRHVAEVDRLSSDDDERFGRSTRR